MLTLGTEGLALLFQNHWGTEFKRFTALKIFQQACQPESFIFHSNSKCLNIWPLLPKHVCWCKIHTFPSPYCSKIDFQKHQVDQDWSSSKWWAWPGSLTQVGMALESISLRLVLWPLTPVCIWQESQENRAQKSGGAKENRMAPEKGKKQGYPALGSTGFGAQLFRLPSNCAIYWLCQCWVTSPLCEPVPTARNGDTHRAHSEGVC